jgi:phosphoribosyl 1,2-cyclic phosphodiesterase
LKVSVLGSGSEGNATVVEAEGVAVLIDAGFSGRDLEQRLGSIGIGARQLGAVLITHDHGDHTRGMGIIARRFDVPLYLTRRTAKACRTLLDGTEDVREYATAERVRIGPFEVEPFLTVHDAVDPVAVTIKHIASGCRMGIATDLGRPTATVRAALAGCHMLILEANHDDAMLWTGPYPWSVKQRIASSHGHLSNRASAALARELLHPGLVAVVLGHLSTHCNDPGLARAAVSRALDRAGYRGPLDVAPQEKPLDPVDVFALRRKIGDSDQLTLF